MITLTRLQLRQIRTVFRRALNVTARAALPQLILDNDSKSLVIRSHHEDKAVEYRTQPSMKRVKLGVPWALLNDCEGRGPDPVEVESIHDGKIGARWQDGGVPMLRNYEPVNIDETAADFPLTPPSLTEHPPQLLTALRDAVSVTDRDAGRYATNCIQLDGKSGSIAATDGRQLFQETGFTLPWDDAVLVPRSTVFGSHALPSNESVHIGKTDDHLVFRTGPWTFWLPIAKDGRFPRVDDVMPFRSDAQTIVHLSDSDANYLTKAIRHLPGDKETMRPVTLDLNGQVALRAKGPDDTRPTELALTGSSYDGQPTYLHTNRDYLERAAHLGFRDIMLYGPERAALGRDGDRLFLWMPLDGGSAVKPSDDCVCIESPGENATAPPKSRRHRRRRIMPRTKTTTNGQANRNGSSQHASLDTVIKQAEAVKAHLREISTQVSELITALKVQRKQSKIVHSTLASLRQLQTLDA